MLVVGLTGFVNRVFSKRCLLDAGDDQWLILASDGLFANEERGGGGGLENQEVVDVCNKSGLPAEKLAQKLVIMAQEAGSTDDITVVVMKLK